MGGEALGGLAVVVLVALAWMCQQQLESPDLAAGLWLAGGEEEHEGDGIVPWAMRLTISNPRPGWGAWSGAVTGD